MSLTGWFIRHEAFKALGLNGKEKKQMLNFIKILLGSSWIVTVLGWVATYLGVTSTTGWTKPDGSVNWLAVGFGIVSAVLFRKIKQDNVTGGTISQPTVPNPPVLPANPSAMAPEVAPGGSQTIGGGR